MAFRMIGHDWWTAKGLSKVTWKEAECIMCQSHFNLGHIDALGAPGFNVCELYSNCNALEAPGFNVCELHSNCTDTAIQLMGDVLDKKRKIGTAEWTNLRLNSYDRDALIPYMSDEVLVHNTEYTLKNCSRIRSPAGTYDEALQLYAAELAKRLNPKENVHENDEVPGV